MNASDVNWPTIEAMTAVIAFVGSLALLVLRAQLARFFVTRSEHDEMNKRVEGVERAVTNAPTHADMKEVLARLSAGQGRFDVLATGIDDVRRAVGRVEHQFDMVIKSQLDRENGR